MPCHRIVISLAVAGLACPVMAGQPDFERIDAHVHVLQASPEYYRMLGALNIRAFLIRYQDRVLYGTDLSLGPEADAGKTIKSMRDIYALDWKYFSSAEWIETRTGRVQGLALPPEALRKIFRENALRWVPGAEK